MGPSSSRVAAWPDEPATTTPCEPCSVRLEVRRRAAGSSTPPSWSKGVAIAVMPPRISLIAGRVSGRSYGKGGRRAVGPGNRLLELRGDPQQQVLAAQRGDQLDADRQAVLAPVQRQ